MSRKAQVHQYNEVPEAEILAHVEALLSNRRFAAAERNGRFLRYVVEQTLEGKADEIKETVIAMEVYGRSGDYDPKSDSIVRVEATRLRQKLRTYYENEGQSQAIRIHLPTGTYVPQFERVAVAEIESDPSETPEPQAASQVTAPAKSKDQRIAWAGIGAAAAILLFSIQLARASRGADSYVPEAVAAWQEGVALLDQDPHAAQGERGAPATLVRAVERLEFAVARDPGFARGWASLAEAYDYALAYVGRDREEDGRRAEAAARRAVAIDSKLATGHHMLGLILWMVKWDFAGAERSYQRTLELDPYNVYAVVEYADLLRETRRLDKAEELIRKSMALQPALPQLSTKEAEINLDRGRVDAALASAEAALRQKRNFQRAYVAAGMAEERKGDYQSALARYEHVLRVNPTDRRALPAYGYLLARTGQLQQAREIARRLEQMNENVRNCAFQVAVVYAGLGENDRALDWLERSWRTHQVHFPFATVEHRFRDLHNLPRFRSLMHRAGLTPLS